MTNKCSCTIIFIRTDVPEHMNAFYGRKAFQENIYFKAGGGNEMRKEQMSVRRMNDGELRFYRCMLRLRRERRRRLLVSMFVMLAVFCMFMTGTILYSSIRTQAASGFKYYTSVTVESGETLWSLADEYVDYEHYMDKNKYIAEVQRINHLDDDCMIMAGQMLIVPYYSDEYVE